MKVFYSLLFFVTFFTAINAQVIPNGDFEEWEILDGINTEFPTGWITSNFSGVGAGLEPNAEKTIDAQQGAFAMKLSTVDGFYANEPLIGSAFYDGAIDYTPTELRGYYKTSLVGDDAAVISVDIISEGSLIGTGFVEIETNQSSYTFFTIKIDYQVSNPNAEWFYLAINSSIDFGVIGSTLFVDGLNFDGITAINDLNSVKLDLVVSPNPVSELLYISVDNIIANSEITIYDNNGIIVETRELAKKLSVDVTQYPIGQYFITIRDSQKKLVQTSNFIVTN